MERDGSPPFSSYLFSKGLRVRYLSDETGTTPFRFTVDTRLHSEITYEPTPSGLPTFQRPYPSSGEPTVRLLLHPTTGVERSLNQGMVPECLGGKESGRSRVTGGSSSRNPFTGREEVSHPDRRRTFAPNYHQHYRENISPNDRTSFYNV